MAPSLSPAEILRWYLEAGVDETIGEEPVDRYLQPPATPQPVSPATAPRPLGPLRSPPPAGPSAAAVASAPPPAGPSAAGALHTAYTLAAAATSLDELRQALGAFGGCPLKETATNLVFCDGNPEARVVLIGEAPGAEEDRLGLPFVGASGRLLDRMLASIGLDRTKVLISNTVFWRPPGNRHPTTTEIATCLPFVERLVELVDPEMLVALGGAAAKALLARSEAVGKLRGQWYAYSTPGMPRPVVATVTFHPAYLLRSPGQKREAWRDLLEIKKKLESL